MQTYTPRHCGARRAVGYVLAARPLSQSSSYIPYLSPQEQPASIKQKRKEQEQETKESITYEIRKGERYISY